MTCDLLPKIQGSSPLVRRTVLEEGAFFSERVFRKRQLLRLKLVLLEEYN